MARLLWPVLIAAAVIIAVVVSAAGEQTRVELEYLDDIRTQADVLSRSGLSVADVMSRVAEIDREEFTTVFESVSEDLAAAQEFVSAEPPTESLIPVWALYRQAVQAWDDGISGLSAAILRAADDSEDITVVNATGDSLADLRAGDALYQDLKVEVEREEIPQPVSPLVDVRMTPTDADLFTQSFSYVAAARRSTNQLGLRPGLQVSQVVSDPLWQANVDGQPVVPATDAVAFSTVITNSGNVASAPESVTMAIVEMVEDAEPIVVSAEVPVLQPDGQTTIQFDAVELLAETPYQVSVTLELSNPDANPDDNTQSVQFIINAS